MEEILKTIQGKDKDRKRFITIFNKSWKAGLITIISAFLMFYCFVKSSFLFAFLFLIVCFVAVSYIATYVRESETIYKSKHGPLVVCSGDAFVEQPKIDYYFGEILKKWRDTRHAFRSERALNNLKIVVLDYSSTIITRKENILFVTGDFLLDSAFKYECHIFITENVLGTTNRPLVLKYLRRYKIL